ncbi:MAG: hypothetical protein ABW217_21830 [Polyangiaceae bacterium]
MSRSALGRRSARQQRGAIFVEAVIVSLMLTILFAGGVFFHRLYSAKIRAVREARLSAWQQAEEGCPSKFGIGQIFNLISIDRCEDDNCSVGGLDTQTDDGPDWLDMGAKTGEASHTATADRHVGGRSYSLRAANRVICNERRQGVRGDLLTLGDYILDAVIQ